MSEPKKSSRKKFLFLSGGAILSALALKMLPSLRKRKDGKVKMLTQDGTLVEIDAKIAAMPGKKISDADLQQWIKNKPGNK